MNYLDFFSQPPKMYIFQKNSNKTTFGGVLFLIYMIIMIIISLIYILDYFLNDKFIIEYSSYLNPNKGSSNIFSYLDIYNSSISEYNPLINVSFNIFKADQSKKINLSERFFIFDPFESKELKRDTFYQKKVSDLCLVIGYKCEDENCTLNQEDYSPFDYYLEIKYNGFVLNHQGDIPLQNDSNIISLL